ncbi:MAG: hypothetical protein WC627_01440 [Legionella sp.]|jgi:hypothetical protein
MVSSFFRFFAKPAKEAMVNTAYTVAATGVGTVTYHLGAHAFEATANIFHKTTSLFPPKRHPEFEFPENIKPEVNQTKTGNPS